jgi:predicted DsbA family dithiol-disulfide isomerase
MQVEIWSDMICPWCYLGKRRFEAALARFEHRDAVEIRWRCPRIDPTASRDGSETLPQAMMRKHGVPLGQVMMMLAGVSGQAAADGLTYRLIDARPVSTFDAHRCMRMAARQGLASEFMDRMSQAYTMEGLSLADHDVLAGLAADVGLESAETRRVLAEGDHADEVLADVDRAREFGIVAAPTYIFDEVYGIAGAEPAKVFLDTLRGVWKQGRVPVERPSSRP